MVRHEYVVAVPIVVSMVTVAAALPMDDWLTTAAFSLAAGVAALAMMGMAALLSARLDLVERMLGGLDRVYVAHKWLGVWALGLASFHFVFRAGMQAWPSASIVPMARDITRFARQCCFIGLMFIVLLALNRAISYGVWRWWHKLSGPLFLVVIVHWLSIKSPIVLVSPAGIWLALTGLTGGVAALYSLLLYRFLAHHATYRVVAVATGVAAVRLTLEPTGPPIAFQPGQFGFLRMRVDGLREPHPFTIANADAADGRVEFVIRALGDFTGALVARSVVGMLADIYAPHGCFLRRARHTRQEVWIGGGVGISPFIAWLNDKRAGSCERATLFYFHTPGREFPDVPAMQALAAERGANFIAVPDGPASPIFHERFNAIVSEFGASSIDVDFCGPRELLQTIRASMRRLKVPASHLRYEQFHFR